MTSDSKAQEEAEREFAVLDFSGIHFPSDGITIASLRKQFPDLFDRGFDDHQPKYFLQTNPNNPAADTGVGSAMFMERLVALGAFARANGLPNPQGWENIDQYKPDLAKFYCEYGLASGEHQAVELIREIERQAAQVVSRRRGR